TAFRLGHFATGGGKGAGGQGGLVREKSAHRRRAGAGGTASGRIRRGAAKPDRGRAHSRARGVCRGRSRPDFADAGRPPEVFSRGDGPGKPPLSAHWKTR